MQTTKFKELIFNEFIKKGYNYKFHNKQITNINYQKTLENMKQGIPILYNHLICDTEHKLYCFPTILIRSDYLKKFFLKSIILINLLILI